MPPKRAAPDDEYGVFDCHRRVQVQCGPDVDGDGQPESIVRIEGDVFLNGKSCKTIADSNDFWPAAKTFVVSGRAGKWRGAQVLGTEIKGDQQWQSTSAGFVRRRDGRFAIEWSFSFDGGDGCEGTDRTFYSLVRGKLRVLEKVADPTPCDEP